MYAADIQFTGSVEVWKNRSVHADYKYALNDSPRMTIVVFTWMTFLKKESSRYSSEICF